ncbi:hypothetical protein [Streptomyces sp. 1222.5]|uniref:hypothetical protein n=1 Tax=Streptomyces sp. 1222.5 TaxID=1881026 RepID=UPI003D70A4FB
MSRRSRTPYVAARRRQTALRCPAVVALVAATAFTGCSRGSGRPESAGPPRPPTSGARPAAGGPDTAALSAALLRAADLPSGYRRTEFPDNSPTRSDRPACVTTLNGLETRPGSGTGVVEARATFAQSRSGPYLQQVLRRLPGSGARQELGRAVRVLSRCAEFSIGWPDGATGTERVEAHGPAGIGDASWHATVTAATGTFTVQENLVLVVVDRTLVVLGDAGSPAAPDRSRTLALARTAASRVP